MSWFVAAFFGAFIGTTALAAYFRQRSLFLFLFSLLLVSAVAGLLGGQNALWTETVIVALGIACAGLAYCYREYLNYLLPESWAKVIRTAPLTGAFGLLVITVYVFAAVFAPIMAPFGESEIVGAQYLPADETFLLGTDNIGRDMFSRLIYGARNTVGVALITTILAFSIGALVGIFAATVGGWMDQLLGRFVDAMMAIPSLIFALLLLTIFGTAIVNMIIIIAFIDSTRVYRLARAVAMNIVVMDYIEAAKLRGESRWYLITREILPNAAAPLVAEFGLRFCFVFLTISALSFLGLGIQPPTADWGSMVKDNATLITFGELTPLYPAAAIALLTIGVNFVVDWMLHRSSGLKE